MTFLANDGNVYPVGPSGYIPYTAPNMSPRPRNPGANIIGTVRLGTGYLTRTKGRITKRINRRTYKQRNR